MPESHQLKSQDVGRGPTLRDGVWLYLLTLCVLPVSAPLLAGDRGDLFPIPEHVEWGKDDLVFADERGSMAGIVIDASACAKAELGADEISARCAELGGRRLRVHRSEANAVKGPRVLIGRAGGSLVDGCLEVHRAAFSGKYALSREMPGDQGYIVRGFLDRLKELKNADGTSTLDSSMVVYGSSIADGHAHEEKNLPILLAGGGGGTLKTGYYVAPRRSTSMSQLHLALLQRMDFPLDQFAETTTPLGGISK